MNTATALILIVLAVIGLLAVKSYLRKIKSGCCGADVQKKEAADTDIRHYPYHQTLRVKGMTCGNCARRVENGLNALEGVYAQADWKGGSVSVHMKREIPPERIRGAIEKTGYRVGESVSKD